MKADSRIADFHAEADPVAGVVRLALALGLYLSAFAWLAFIALEPYVRRRWPQVLIAWARLAAGNWRDPLVARDVLIGVMVGAALQATAVLELAATRGLVFGPRSAWPLDGFRFAMSWWRCSSPSAAPGCPRLTRFSPAC
jgi:hypothetical protein